MSPGYQHAMNTIIPKAGIINFLPKSQKTMEKIPTGFSESWIKSPNRKQNKAFFFPLSLVSVCYLLDSQGFPFTTAYLLADLFDRGL